MIIAIDLTSLSYHLSGIERYALCMAEKMIKKDSKNKYILVFRDSVYPSFDELIDTKRVQKVVLHGKNKLLFNQIVLPLSLYKIKADKYLFFAFTSPVLFRRRGIINTIHDMGAWDFADALKPMMKLYYRITCICAVSVAEMIITVSEFSKARIKEVLHVPEKKINVIYSGVYERIRESKANDYEIIKEKYNLPANYIMTLGTLEPRKNIKLLIDAYMKVSEHVAYDLVLVGRKGWKLEEVLGENSNSDRIHITGFVEDDHLGVVYKMARCFVFPTLYEGFGLPPVEALSFGVPVISSDAASMPEILGDRAYYFKSNNIEDLETILLNLDDIVEYIPKELSEYQRMNYSFDTSAEKLLKIINSGGNYG